MDDKINDISNLKTSYSQLNSEYNTTKMLLSEENHRLKLEVEDA